MGISLPPREELDPTGGGFFPCSGQLGSDETPAGWALIKYFLLVQTLLRWSHHFKMVLFQLFLLGAQGICLQHLLREPDDAPRGKTHKNEGSLMNGPPSSFLSQTCAL